MTSKRRGRLRVTKQNDSGRNTKFEDTVNGKTMTRPQVVRLIKKGEYPDYHTRQTHGLETPVSNPDGKKRNNLDR